MRNADSQQNDRFRSTSARFNIDLPGHLVPLQWPGRCNIGGTVLILGNPPGVLLIVGEVLLVLLGAPPRVLIIVRPPSFLVRQLITEDWKYGTSLKITR